MKHTENNSANVLIPTRRQGETFHPSNYHPGPNACGDILNKKLNCPFTTVKETILQR